jgi:purine-cytosine permease-like protein
MLSNIFLALISTILFGIIDSVIFLFFEKEIQSTFENIDFFDKYSAELLTGGISAACALSISSMMEQYIEHYIKDIIKHPLLDAFGILIGTFIVIILYKFYNNYKNKKNNNNNNNNNNK